MKIALGLPNAVPDVPNGRVLVDIARRAEVGFSSLATIGRTAYPNYEELVTLAAAAGATKRIGLFTDVLLGPAREAVMLAKQAASLDQLSGGRFVLGAGVGFRQDDYGVSGFDFKTRGRRWNASLDLMHRAWRGELIPGADRVVAPRPTNGRGVPMMFGGKSDQAIARTVTYGIGHTRGGGTAEELKVLIDRVRSAWTAAGRAGAPQFRALAFFVLGSDAQSWGERSIKDYYGVYGKETWDDEVLKDAQAAKASVQAFEAVGCDELILFATVPSVDQVDRLAAAVL